MTSMLKLATMDNECIKEQFRNWKLVYSKQDKESELPDKMESKVVEKR
jgi:hypothetical protein